MCLVLLFVLSHCGRVSRQDDSYDYKRVKVETILFDVKDRLSLYIGSARNGKRAKLRRQGEK